MPLRFLFAQSLGEIPGLKVLLATKFYYRRGGDAVYTLALENLLRSHGHETAVFASKHPDDLPSPHDSDWVSPIDFARAHERRSLVDVLRVPFRSVLSYEAFRKLDRLLEKERFDVAHLQNIHFHLTPSILYALEKHRVPVVWTLHDYVLLCPVATFLSKGSVCEACRPTRYYQAVLKRCQRGSVSASTLAALASAVPRLLGVYSKVHRFLTPSRFMHAKFIEFGFPEENLAQVPHFLDCANIQPSKGIGGYFLYVGRLSREKGPDVLARVGEWHPELEIRLVGDGPDDQELKQMYGHLSRVRFMGRREGDELAKLYSGALAVIVPSLCYENFPMVILEAYAHGKPVVVSRLGALPDLVKEGATGLLFEPGNSTELGSRLKELASAPERAREMGTNGRKWLEREFGAEAHYEKLQRIYEEASATRGSA